MAAYDPLKHHDGLVELLGRIATVAVGEVVSHDPKRLGCRLRAIRGAQARNEIGARQGVHAVGGKSARHCYEGTIEAAHRPLHQEVLYELVISGRQGLGGWLFGGPGRQGWALVDLGSGVDMSTPAGEMVAGVLLSAAQYERRLIGVRTKEGLASAKARGVALGKPTSYPDELLVRIHDMHRDGLSLRQIAEELSAAGVTTAKGGGWYASSIRSVLNSERMAALVAA